jgi:hypothetical protein
MFPSHSGLNLRKEKPDSADFLLPVAWFSLSKLYLPRKYGRAMKECSSGGCGDWLIDDE